MRKIFGVVFGFAAILFAWLLLGYLPEVIRVEDLSESGSGLELGEWQVSVGVFVCALVLFSILAVLAFRLPFASGLLIISWLALLSVAAATGFVYSVKDRTGVINEHGHGLSYDAWWASAIPWTIATALVGLCAISSLIHAILKRGHPDGNIAKSLGAPGVASSTTMQDK